MSEWCATLGHLQLYLNRINLFPLGLLGVKDIDRDRVRWVEEGGHLVSCQSLAT